MSPHACPLVLAALSDVTNSIEWCSTDEETTEPEVRLRQVGNVASPARWQAVITSCIGGQFWSNAVRRFVLVPGLREVT